MNRDQVLALLLTNAYELWIRTLDGGRSASTEAMYLVLDNPQPGDLVLEVSSYHLKGITSGFGRLIKVAIEPIDEWSEEDEELNGPRPSMKCWHIEDIDGQGQRWYNCKFIRVLEKRVNPIKEAKARGIMTPELARRLDEIQERVSRYTKGHNIDV